MMDKVEAPPITDGYGLSLAFLAMLDVTRCVQVCASIAPSLKANFTREEKNKS